MSGAALIAAASLASRLLGVFRDRVLAGEFGAGNTLDVYYAAFRLPDLLYNLLIVGALTAGFIPVFVAARDANHDKKDGEHWRVANIFFTTTIAVMALLCAILMLFTPAIVPWITPGFPPDKMQAVVALSRVMFFSPLLLGASAVLGGVLQSYKKFFVYSLAPIFYNVGIIIGVLFLAPHMGTIGLAWGVVLGAALHFLVQVPAALRTGWPFRLNFAWGNKNVRTIWRLMLPRTLALGASQINLVLLTVVASFMAAGSLAVFNLASNLATVPVAIFGISYAIAAFPVLSEYAAAKDHEGFRQTHTETVSQIFFFIVPTTVLFLVLRAQIVRAVLGSSIAFDWTATTLTFNTLAWLSVSLFAQALIPLLDRALYAYLNSVIPLVAGVVGDVLTVVISYIFRAQLGVEGIAIAYSVGAIIEAIVLWLVLRKRSGGLDEGFLSLTVGRFVAAGLVMAFVAQGLKTGLGVFLGTTRFIDVALQGGIAAIFSLAAYILVLVLLRDESVTDLMHAMEEHVIGFTVKHEGLDEGEGI